MNARTSTQVSLQDANAHVVTRAQLSETLRKTRGCRIITIITETEPEMLKTDNPYVGRVVKVSTVNGVIGFDYENSVNNQRVREANPQTVEEAVAVEAFEAAPRKWGQRVAGTPLVEHKGSEYLEVKVERTEDPVYVVDGKTATPEVVEELKQYFPKRKGSPNQQVNREVVLRDYKVENIRAIRWGGEQFWVV